MIRNSSAAWGWPAIVLHWLGAALIVVLLAHGWWMTHFAPRPDRLANYGPHAALGYDFLALLILRLLWRWINLVPSLEGQVWERYAAKAAHIALYVNEHSVDIGDEGLTAIDRLLGRAAAAA